MITRKHKVFPLPEAISRTDIDATKWKLKEDGKHPRVSMSKKEMFVPLGDSDYERFIRAHESAHVAFSPPNPDALVPEGLAYIVGALEDIRVNHLMGAYGIDLDSVDPLVEKENGRPPLNFLAPPEVTLLAILSAMETGTYKKIKEWAAKELTPLYDTLRKLEKQISMRMNQEDWTFEGVMKIAEELKELFKMAERVAEETAAVVFGEGEEKDGKKPPETGKLSDPDSHTAIALKRIADMVKMKDMQFVEWGEMSVKTFPMPKYYTGALRKKMRRSVTEGVFLKHPHRWCTDRKVFGEKRKIKGGAILIDVSGSMQIEKADILEILKYAPECVVALYSADLRSGTVRVIAKDGRQSDSIPVGAEYGEGNVIDGPALEWLGTQKEPRIWVCDGGVTGIGDEGGRGNKVVCANLCAEGNVYMAERVDIGVELLKDLSKGKKITPRSTLGRFEHLILTTGDPA